MLEHRLKVFVSVVENGNLTKAGEELFISQPAITRHIKNLEFEMGTKLVVFKSGYGMKLSSHGEILFEYCKAILEKEQELRNKLSNHKNIIPSFEIKEKPVLLCDDPMYLNSIELNHMVSQFVATRYEREKIYGELKQDIAIRKKVYVSGTRRFFFYHKEDVQRFLSDKFSGGKIN